MTLVKVSNSCPMSIYHLYPKCSSDQIVLVGHLQLNYRQTMSLENFIGSIIIDFPNLWSTYNGGWCTATESDETLISRPSCEVNVK